MKRNWNSIRATHGSEDGFTLIELMVAVIIIGVLAAIAIPVFANQQKASIQATVKSDTKTNVGAVARFLTKEPQAPILNKHSDYPNVADRPHIYITGDNVANISGAWDDYKVLVKNADRTYACTFTSTTGKTLCESI